MRTLLRMVIGLVSIIAFLHGGEAEAAQPLASLPPPIVDTTLQYSSPYGPRNLEGAGYQFHGGVDYKYGIGTPIYAVQGGTIVKIWYDFASGWLIGIAGGSTDPFPGAYFSYLHLFDDSWITAASLPTDQEGHTIFARTQANFITGGTPLAVTVTLEVVGTGAGQEDCFAIIFWRDFLIGDPLYALSPCAGLPIRNIVTQNTISQEASTLIPIAVVGASGAAHRSGAHLHLQVNSGDQNPLLYVEHDYSDPPAYPLSIFKDKGDTQTVLDANKVRLHGGEVLDPTQDSPLRIRTEVNYANAGHDNDDVEILMFKQGTAEPDPTTNFSDYLDCVISGRCKVSNYGGTGRDVRTVSKKHCTTDDPCDPIQEGVYGQLHNGGVVDFLTDPIDLTSLDPGDYVILVRASNILGQSEETSLTVTIPPPPFSATASCDGPFPNNTGSGFYDTINIHERFSYPFPQHFNINQAPSFLDIPTDPSDPSNPFFPALASYTSIQRPSYVNTHSLYMAYLSSVMATFLKPNPNWTTGAPGGAFKIILDNGQMTCQASVSNDGYFPPYVCTTHSSLSTQDVIDWGISLSMYTPLFCDAPSTFNGVPSCDHYSPLPLGNFSISVPFPEFPDSTAPTPTPKQFSLACP